MSLIKYIDENILKLDLFKPIEKEEIEVPKEIKLLAEKRWEAKKNKDFATADKIRDELLEKWWKVLDKKEGYELVNSEQWII